MGIPKPKFFTNSIKVHSIAYNRNGSSDHKNFWAVTFEDLEAESSNVGRLYVACVFDEEYYVSVLMADKLHEDLRYNTLRASYFDAALRRAIEEYKIKEGYV